MKMRRGLKLRRRMKLRIMMGRRMLTSLLLLKLFMMLRITVNMERLKTRMRKKMMKSVLKITEGHMVVREKDHLQKESMSTRVLLARMHCFQSCG
ncbi:hypothetical protein Bca4012_083574 [Brassica carinata]